MRVVKKAKSEHWLLLGVAFVAVGIILASCRGAKNGASDFEFIGDTAQVRGVWLSRSIDALWLRRQSHGQWQVGEDALAEKSQVHSLLEILSALRFGVELSDRGTDSLRSGLAGDGLQVLIEYNNGSSDAYTLFLPQAKKPCVYSPTLKRGWMIDILGFDEAFIVDLSLRKDDWYSFAMGVERPSDLRAVALVWRGDLRNSFAMQIGDGYATRVVSLADTTQPVECDTARMSVFLHSLTSLRSFALTAQQSDSLRAWSDTGQFDCTLSLELQRGDTLSYRLLLASPIRQEGITASASNVGYLFTNRGEVRRFLPSDWDVTLLPLSDLLLEGE